MMGLELRPIRKVRIDALDLTQDEDDAGRDADSYTFEVIDLGNGLGYIKVWDSEGYSVGTL